MKNTQVLALKYRPKEFKDLIGQEEISQTIYNSIQKNKIPNAFLFHGIRGTGKTSIARIIARSMNCENGIENICKENFCSNCNSIISSSHLDVIEQDCATATGIDSVRDLIEFCRYPPSSAKYKVLILDEIQAMSKAGAQSLLKILEEPPDYVRFIFCTTEIKKILVTIISRCTRFDLSRVESKILFNYLKKIKEKENGMITDEALKLICKCSEGSVRDALSLLDRAILSADNGKELTIDDAQKIFGHFDKSRIIEIIEMVLQGNENETLSLYREIYKSGADPSTFLNDFLEIIYYLKNIKTLEVSGTSFDLNSNEFKALKSLSELIDNDILIIFWQFTINTLDEIKLVANQNLSVEMFLLRLLYMKEYNNEKNYGNNENKTENYLNTNNNIISNEKKKPINQIKSVIQQDELKINYEDKKFNKIESFSDLIKVCNIKKEMKLKYDLETNVNLVKFENNKIEISFNENLDKDFVKDLSSKLLDWTNERWIIALSKEKGDISKKELKKKEKNVVIDNFKNTYEFKKIQEVFEDAVFDDIES